MCGIPGSGKSTYADRLAAEENFIVHSSDKIREELGDVNDQSRNEEVFKILHKRIKGDLQNGKNVVFDATNLNRKKRVAFVKELKNIPCKKICVLAATPGEICLAQNQSRDRQVPVNVLERMIRNFQMPSTHEGFDEVIVHYEKEEWKEYYGDIDTYVESLRDFDQENPHHVLSLGDHMFAAERFLLEKGIFCKDVTFAAFSHDIGKPVTKAFINGKGEQTIEAHYFNHHNVGAYSSLFFDYPYYTNKEYVALLIELHMKPYMEWKQSDKAREKDLQLFGTNVINDVELLHEADVFAH